MADLPNLYHPGTMPGLDPRTNRVMMDLFDRVNYLTTELDRVRGMAESASPGVDSAKREQNTEGLITIPGSKSNGFIRVSKDGVIISYASEVGDLIGIPINLQSRTDTVNSVGNGPDTLHTFILRANTLRNTGDYLDVWYGGNFGASAILKSVQAFIGTAQYDPSGTVDVSTAVGWTLNSRIIRVSPTTCNINNWALYNGAQITSAAVPSSFGGGWFTASRNSVGVSVGSNMSTTDITLKVTSQTVGGAAADVFQSMSIINLTRVS